VSRFEISILLPLQLNKQNIVKIKQKNKLLELSKLMITLIKDQDRFINNVKKQLQQQKI